MDIVEQNPIIINLVLNFFISLAASISTVFIVLFLIERQRKPILSIRIEKGHIVGGRGDPLKRPALNMLTVEVHNNPQPRYVSWFHEQTPVLVYNGLITFHHLDGHRVFAREMHAAWGDRDNPNLEMTETEQGIALKIVNVQESINIPAGESTRVRIVIKQADMDECYGWTHESYLHNWLHPEWRLEKGRYIVKLAFKASGRTFEDAFLIVNDVPYTDFRLEQISEKQKASLR